MKYTCFTLTNVYNGVILTNNTLAIPSSVFEYTGILYQFIKKTHTRNHTFARAAQKNSTRNEVAEFEIL